MFYEGVCVGGPLAGSLAVSRYPEGFLLVDRPHRLCWIYDWDDDKDRFVVRDPVGAALLDEGPKNRWRAAEEASYDVLAAPWIGGEQP